MSLLCEILDCHLSFCVIVFVTFNGGRRPTYRYSEMHLHAHHTVFLVLIELQLCDPKGPHVAPLLV